MYLNVMAQIPIPYSTRSLPGPSLVSKARPQAYSRNSESAQSRMCTYACMAPPDPAPVKVSEPSQSIPLCVTIQALN